MISILLFLHIFCFADPIEPTPKPRSFGALFFDVMTDYLRPSLFLIDKMGSMVRPALTSDERKFVWDTNHTLDSASTFEAWSELIRFRTENKDSHHPIQRQILDQQIFSALRFGDDFISWFDRLIKTRELEGRVGHNQDVSFVDIFAEVLQRTPAEHRTYQKFIEEIVNLMSSPSDQHYISVRLARSFVNSEKGLNNMAPLFITTSKENFGESNYRAPWIPSITYFAYLEKQMFVRVLAISCAQGTILHLQNTEFNMIKTIAQYFGYELQGTTDQAQIVFKHSKSGRCLRYLSPMMNSFNNFL